MMNSQLGFNETVSPDELVVRNGIFYKKFTDTPFIGEVSGQQNGNIKKWPKGWFLGIIL